MHLTLLQFNTRIAEVVKSGVKLRLSGVKWGTFLLEIDTCRSADHTI